MQLDLSGRRALVCGASRGIGRACAIELASLGASVTVLARSPEPLQALVDALPRPQGQQHAAVALDLADSATTERELARLVAAQPHQILINNSGGPPPGAAHQTPPDAYLAALRQHLVGAQIALQALLPGMREAGWGRVVNIISTSVREPIPGLGVSNTTRAAVAAWAKTLSRELAAAGITVNNVLPGYTRTDRLNGLIAGRAKAAGSSEAAVAEAMLADVPAARFGDAAEIAAVAAFLCSPAAAYVNGVSIAVDGGRTRALA